MSYVQKIFSGNLTDGGYEIFEEKIGQSKKRITGVLIHPEGNAQKVSVTLRYCKGTKAVFRKIDIAKKSMVDGIPYGLSKNFHPLSLSVQQDILTGSISSQGTGKVNIFLRYD
ncbi:hypothetical protein [Chondrinema litorale]|uniref:hypothetical protein n=1 Tax=Chondrinema litorale TaxID=2994555 RepID=UPI0025432FFA|nr:hypothetical protein [Chondrinema litorale]UZR95320.1 hypothetical protein OQ292_05735 [Chondrinema litorale]